MFVELSLWVGFLPALSHEYLPSELSLVAFPPAFLSGPLLRSVQLRSPPCFWQSSSHLDTWHMTRPFSSCHREAPNLLWLRICSSIWFGTGAHLENPLLSFDWRVLDIWGYPRSVYCLDTQAGSLTWRHVFLREMETKGCVSSELRWWSSWSWIWLQQQTLPQQPDIIAFSRPQATPPRWTSPATNGESPAGRFGHSAVMDGTGKMWIFGGRPSSSSSSHGLSHWSWCDGDWCNWCRRGWYDFSPPKVSWMTYMFWIHRQANTQISWLCANANICHQHVSDFSFAYHKLNWFCFDQFEPWCHHLCQDQKSLCGESLSWEYISTIWLMTIPYRTETMGV